MRRTVFLALIMTAICISCAFGAPAPDPKPSIDAYIRAGWSTLRRSVTADEAYADTKVGSAPTLYLPAGFEVPPEVARLSRERGVTVTHLPRPIRHLGEVRPSELPAAGLLYLPHPYVVPGGMFNEMYGWDSYFIVRGLLEDGQVDAARQMVENWFFEIEHYGAILNANRSYYLTRSQPPFLTSAVRAVYERTHDRQWLARALHYAERDHATWTTAPFLAGTTGLSRYYDVGDGPIPEMGHHESYYEQVAAWVLTHPGTADYVRRAVRRVDSALPILEVRVSRDGVSSDATCIALSADYYKGDRAMRASGFDVSFRFGPFSGETHHYAPVCLNALLYKTEIDLAELGKIVGRDPKPYEDAARRRAAAMRALLWNAKTGTFFDYNFTRKKQSTYAYATMAWPLWAGLATAEEATRVARRLAALEQPHGLAMSGVRSGAQWDLPFGWAPAHLLAVEGLLRYRLREPALRLARKFNDTVRRNYDRDGTIREKYDVVTGSSQTRIGVGYADNVVGFGWTNAVYRVFESLLR